VRVPVNLSSVFGAIVLLALLPTMVVLWQGLGGAVEEHVITGNNYIFIYDNATYAMVYAVDNGAVTAVWRIDVRGNYDAAFNGNPDPDGVYRATINGTPANYLYGSSSSMVDWDIKVGLYDGANTYGTYIHVALNNGTIQYHGLGSYHDELRVVVYYGEGGSQVARALLTVFVVVVAVSIAAKIARG